MASTSPPPATTDPASSPATGTATAPATTPESAPAPATTAAATTTTTTTSPSTSNPVDVPASQQQQQLDAPMQAESTPTSSPVEMSTLVKDNAATTAPATTNTTITSPTTAPTSTSAAGPSTSSQSDPLTSSSSAAADAVETDSLALTVTILAVDGPRHPIKLSSSYLVRRKIKADGNDPMNMRVIQLKDLIWGEWQTNWPARPTSPNSIRLISFGKVMDDESLLKDNKFNRETGNIVHMAIKPQEVVDEEDAKGAHSSRPRSTQDRSPGCRCVIM